MQAILDCELSYLRLSDDNTSFASEFLKFSFNVTKGTWDT